MSTEPGTALPRNAPEIFELEHAGAQLLCATVRGGFQSGHMPPKAVLDWYGEYITQGLIAVEQQAMALTAGSDEVEVGLIDRSLQAGVATVAELIQVARSNKLLVLEDKVLGLLRMRRLYLPQDFDPTYGAALPPH